MYIWIDNWISIRNKSVTITFDNVNIKNIYGEFLMTAKLTAIIDNFKYLSAIDKVSLAIFEVGTLPIYVTMITALIFLFPSNFGMFFNTIFETFLILLVPVRFDLVTVTITQILLSPLFAFDFIGIIEPVASEYLPTRFTDVGISPQFYANVGFPLAVLCLTYFLIFILRLQIKAHSFTKKSTKVALAFLKLWMYMDMAGFYVILRTFFPQLFFVSFLFIRFYTDQAGYLNIIFPVLCFLYTFAIMGQYFMVCSISIHGKNSRVDRKRTEDQDGKEKKADGEVDKEVDIDEDPDLEDSYNKPLKNRNIENSVNKKFKKELDMEQVEEEEIGLKERQRRLNLQRMELEKSLVNYSKILFKYNRKFRVLFQELKVDHFWVRLFPFIELLTSSIFIFVIVVLQNSIIIQTIALFLIQIAFAVYTAALRPYILIIENTRLVLDRILNGVITLIIMIMAIDETNDIMSEYTRVRILERGILYIFMMIKIFLNFLYFLVKSLQGLKYHWNFIKMKIGDKNDKKVDENNAADDGLDDKNKNGKNDEKLDKKKSGKKNKNEVKKMKEKEKSFDLDKKNSLDDIYAERYLNEENSKSKPNEKKVTTSIDDKSINRLRKSSRKYPSNINNTLKKRKKKLAEREEANMKNMKFNI